MVKFTDIYPAISTLLKPGDITDDTEVTITGYEIRNLKTFKGDVKPFTVLSFAGLEKELRLNFGTGDKIKQAYGDEQDEWIGKKIILFPDKVRTPDGMKDSIQVRVPAGWRSKKDPQKPLIPSYDERNPPTDNDDDSGY